MKTLIKTSLFAALAVFTFACKKSQPAPADPTPVTPVSPTNNLTKIGEGYITGAKAKAVVYSAKTLETGYNEIFIAFYDSTNGSLLSKGHMTLTPIMNMGGGMFHGSPAENTADSVPANGNYRTAAVFPMIGTSSEWSLKITYLNSKNGFSGTGNIGVAVNASSPSKFKNTTIPLDSNAYIYISLIRPTNPQVGINDFEIVLHNAVTAMSYPAINNYSVEIDPEMPSMGHSSPNNVNPVLTGNGHYVGKVNFTMTGQWQVKLNLKKNGTLISNDQYFDLTVQ